MTSGLYIVYSSNLHASLGDLSSKVLQAKRLRNECMRARVASSQELRIHPPSFKVNGEGTKNLPKM